MLLAAIVWLPLAVLELAGAARGLHLDPDHSDHGEALVGFAVVLVFELLTTELLAAASEKLVGSDVRGTHLPTFGKFLRNVPWVGLLLGALVYELGVAIGLLLFVVPGVLMFVWGVVSGPVITAEGCSPIRAPWRSRELVRGSFRTVLLVAFLGFVLTEAIAERGGSGARRAPPRLGADHRRVLRARRHDAGARHGHRGALLRAARPRTGADA